MKLLQIVVTFAVFTFSAHIAAEIVHTPSFSIEKNQTFTENKTPKSEISIVKDKVKA